MSNMDKLKENPTLEEPNETMEARYGWFFLKDPQITSLPDNLTVRGNLDLRGTAITALPDNLTVRGSLYIDGTQITALPDNLTVDGEIYILVDGRYTFTERRRRSKHDTLRDC